VLAAALFDEVGIESASDDRSITCPEGTTMRKLVAVAAGIVVAAVVAEDYMGVVVVDVVVGGNQSLNRLNFARTRCRS